MQFKGFKQVLKSTYNATTTANKKGYMWFVRESSGSTEGEIYLGTRKYSGGGSLSNIVVPITYTELKTLVNSSNLVPGVKYRITDYNCTVSSSGVTSANHQFDVMVEALSSSELSCEAKAIKHQGDTYFTNNLLEQWKIKYAIINTSLFNWIDVTNNKGVIYYLEDEYGNSAPYDFKNILFNGKYTFNTETNTDGSIDGTHCLCKIGENFAKINGSINQTLPFNIIEGESMNCIIESGVKNVTLVKETGETGVQQNVTIHRGVNGTSSEQKVINIPLNSEYPIDVYNKDAIMLCI